MDAASILEERREKWKTKEVLRRLYFKWYSLIGDWIRPGVVLELGGGSGNLKEYFPDAISSDILFTKWLDAVFDAQRIPVGKESVDSIVLFDVLHHLPEPALFFSEAERALKTGGRIVMMEPYVSCSSYFIYRFLHQEGLKRDGNPLRCGNVQEGKDPFQGNQAIPSLIFETHRELFLKRYPGLKIISEQKLDFLTYPLSGGFHHLNFCPLSFYGLLERLERLLSPLQSYLAFRMFIVIEKISLPETRLSLPT
ncbi:MAG: class I SAM-dependent methyltransferase [Desulfobacteraceae bacterium]|nr:MAG: class I SAM-dependent methyltransferase [Desulfobacteraceae bacterium]